MPTSTPPSATLPVTCAVAGVAGLATLGVSWLADAAREHDGPSRLDPVTAAEVLRIRTPTVTDVAHALSLAGGEVVVGTLALVALVWLVARREPGRAAVVATAIGGSAFLIVAVKTLVGRQRPGLVDRLGPPDTSYSFPSGHTLESAVLLAVVVWLLWPTASRLARAGLVTGAVVLAVGVGASRVYLGYHWLTDVIASGLVAVGWLSLVWMLRGPLQRVGLVTSRLVLELVRPAVRP
jgi:undecaprenyl-diphosphatase